MRSNLVLLLILPITIVCLTVTLNHQFLNATLIPFEAKPNYLQLTLDPKYLTDIIYQLNNTHFEKHGKYLITRNEAHITILTPPEIEALERWNITMSEIHDLVDEIELQNISFGISCLGKGMSFLPIEPINSNKLNQHIFDRNSMVTLRLATTYYLVATIPNSKQYKPIPELLHIRKLVLALLIGKNGPKDIFFPNNYHPHVTLAFDIRDLFDQDGVVKDEKSCVKEVLIV